MSTPPARALPGRLTLLGHPVAHSLSPAFQNAALRAAGIPLQYEALDVPPSALAATFERLVAARGAGNVTVPHKEAARARCDRVTPLAAAVAAVNTFWSDDGMLVGDNTDVDGCDRAARALLAAGAPEGGREHPPGRVAIIGAGGSAAAAAWAFTRWPGCTVRLWSRRAEQAALLADRLGGGVRVAPTLAEAVRGAQLVVNATPLGLQPGDPVPVPVSMLAAETAVLDLVYRRGETRWVHEARARGLPAADGLGMLIEQGALAFERWFGVAPDRDAMWTAVGGRRSGADVAARR